MTIHTEGYMKSYDSTELYYVKDMVDNPKGIIVIVHGFEEHLGRYNHITKRLNQEGYGIYRFDNRGHGRTKGEKGHIESFESFILDTDYIVNMAKRENSGVPIFMLGHSMGGFITASYGIRYKDKLNGQIFSGAATTRASEVKGIKGSIFKLLNIAVPKFRIKNPISNTLCSNERVVENYISDPLNLKDATLNFYVEFLVNGVDWLNMHMEAYNYPCLILHGSEDKIVSKDASINFYNKIQSLDKNIIIYEDLYHEIMNEKTKDKVIDDIILWLKDRIPTN